jgi:hypothetical protein
MATMKQSVGSLTNFGSVTNLNSLANNAAKPLGEVDNSTNDYPNAKLFFVFNLATSNLQMGGTIEIYFMGKIEERAGDNLDWDDEINANDTNDISTDIFNLRRIKTLNANNDMNSEDIVWNCNDLSAMHDQDGNMIGDLPPYWSLVVWNKSGQALAASGNIGQYINVTYTT